MKNNGVSEVLKTEIPPLLRNCPDSVLIELGAGHGKATLTLLKMF
jgi:hypothetical protein